MRLARTAVIVFAACALMALAAGCGGSDDSAAGTTATGQAVLTAAEQDTVAHFLAEVAFVTQDPTTNRPDLPALTDRFIAIAKAKPTAVYEPNAASTLPARTMSQLVDELAGQLDPGSAEQLRQRVSSTAP